MTTPTATAIHLLATENAKHPRFALLKSNGRGVLAKAMLEQRIRDDIEDAVHHSPLRTDPCAQAGRTVNLRGHGPWVEALIQREAHAAIDHI